MGFCGRPCAHKTPFDQVSPLSPARGERGQGGEWGELSGNRTEYSTYESTQHDKRGRSSRENLGVTA